MILSGYRNPPYRTPTPKGKQISPPPGPSPKRKRTDSQSAGAGPPLQVNTNHVVESIAAVPETPAESPRTSVVVAGLRDLDISQPQSAAGATHRSHASPRKRLKRQPHLQAPDVDYEHHSPEIYSTPEPSSQPALVDEASLEISETPVRRTQGPASSPPEASDAHRLATEPQDVRSQSVATSGRKARFQSPPPRSPTTPVAEAMEIADTPSSQSQSSDSSDVDRVALTWQESEITGQDIDTTSPDDDGEGINGIGFKPTAAMAQARSQRRKQQVNEWKAREARDARERRFQRRRGAAAAEAKSRNGKRSVRFEGVG